MPIEAGSVTIAITSPKGGRQPGRGSWRAAMESAVPRRSTKDWQLYGYDVADEGLLSAVMNCGYLDRESAAKARELWDGQLNDKHLFTDVFAAADFAQEADSRVPEHAPFFVFGLWKIATW